MKSPHQSTENLQNATPRLSTNQPFQQACSLTNQPPDSYRRSSIGPASSDQSLPTVPDESSFRASPSLPVLIPFYTIVSDATEPCSSAEIYYPRVRYIFADDDPDVLTDAFEAQQRQLQSKTSKTCHVETKSLSRPILLDLELSPNGQGYAVACATSLATDWAVKRAQLQHMHTSSSGESPESEDSQKMILQVEGLGLSTNLSTAMGPALASELGREGSSLRQNAEMPQLGRQYSDLICSFEVRTALLHSVAQSFKIIDEKEDKTNS